MGSAKQILSQAHSLCDDVLVGELDALGVHFLSGGDGRTHTCLTSVELVAGLSASPDARVQSALIPLLLARPDYAEGVMAALGQLPPPAQLLLQCYYTAATYLQRKYTSALQAAQLPLQPLPPLFVETLNLPTFASAEASLVQLALRQTELSGDSANWLGAYEHALHHLLRQQEKQRQWSS